VALRILIDTWRYTWYHDTMSIVNILLLEWPIHSGCSYRERIGISLGCIGEVFIQGHMNQSLLAVLSNKVYDYEKWEDMGSLL